MNSYNLLPNPRQVTRIDGGFILSNVCLILVELSESIPNLFTAQYLQQIIVQSGYNSPEITSSRYQIDTENIIALRIDQDLIGHQQGYRISMTPKIITITGNDPSGLFYGVCTLNQLIRQTKATHSETLPNLNIYDWPDFPARGVLLDISRDKVPTMETLYQLVDILASLKINQLQLYTEHTFAYKYHPKVWAEASPITSQEVLLLDAYCKNRHIDLVPNQNSFGHMHRWLALPEYESLGELYKFDGNLWWGSGSFSLCPEDPRSFELIAGLYKEIIPLFSSKMVNVGCDETFDLGLGRSKTACDERGKGQVYLDFLLKIFNETKTYGRIMQYWGDIVLQDPELIPFLPKNAVALEWGYEAEHPFEKNTSIFSNAGIPFYVCPGTSSWNTISGRIANMKENIQNAAHYGLKNGAIGLLNTDWGDNGHWQALPISYPGYAVGAAYSWCENSVLEEEIFPAVSMHLFNDITGITGQLMLLLGNVYKLTQKQASNASVLFLVLQSDPEKIKSLEIPTDEVKNIQSAINQIKQLFLKCDIQTEDKSLLEEELIYTVRLLEHSLKRILYFSESNGISAIELTEDLQEIIRIFKKQWLARNRIGGLKDSVDRFNRMLGDYK